jgi:hypothetical protein
MAWVGGADNVAKDHLLVSVQMSRWREFDLNGRNHGQGGGAKARHLFLLRLSDEP